MAPTAGKLQPIQRHKLADLAAERIGDWISASGLKPGEKLPSEQGLMDALGLGRSVVREALAKLKAVGVIVTHQGLGAFVAELPFELLRQRVRRLGGDAEDSVERLNFIWEIREIFEVAVAELAARRRTESDLKDLDCAVQEMARANDNGDWGVEQDAMFHYYLTCATHNPLLVELIEDISSLIQSSRKDSLSRTGRPPLANAEHKAILEAVRRGNPRTARMAMRKHLTNGKRLSGASTNEAKRR